MVCQGAVWTNFRSSCKFSSANFLNQPHMSCGPRGPRVSCVTVIPDSTGVSTRWLSESRTRRKTSLCAQFRKLDSQRIPVRVRVDSEESCLWRKTAAQLIQGAV